MSSPFIIIDEITEKINEMNTSLTTKIDTISSNTTTIINNTKVNNTASGTGSLSQKLSWIGNTLIGATGQTGGSATAGTVMAKLNAAITNTAATTTENSSGTLSAKLSYLINRRNKTVTPSSTVIKTLNSSGTVSSTQTTGNAGQYLGTNGTVYTCYAKYSGTYRMYATASGSTTNANLINSSYATSRIRLMCYVYRHGSGANSEHSVTIASATTPKSGGVTSMASATKSLDVPVGAGDRIQLCIRAESQAGCYHQCAQGTYASAAVTATWTDISIRGTVNELSGAVT